jgi:methionyl-tRNA formyltransferase
MGTPGAAVPTLRRCLYDGHEIVAVWTQPDRPSGRGHRVSFSPVKEFAVAHDLPVYQPAKIKNDEALQTFASHDADVAVVVAYGRILPDQFLQTPRRGCINVHFSLLPLYRGAAPANWAIVNGEFGANETAPELMERLAEIGAELLGETLSRLNDLTPRPQRDQDATFAPILKKEDGLIDWSRSAIEIERAVRGFQPWPNAFTYLNSGSLTLKPSRLTVWQAEPLEIANPRVTAGAVLIATDDELLVNCGHPTALRIIEVQPEARKRMTVRDFLNGTHVKVGDRFG